MQNISEGWQTNSIETWCKEKLQQQTTTPEFKAFLLSYLQKEATQEETKVVKYY